MPPAKSAAPLRDDPRWQALRKVVDAREAESKVFAPNYQLIARWLDALSPDDRAELALLETVVAEGGPTEAAGFAAVAHFLKGPITGYPLSARLEQLRRVLACHDTHDTLRARFATPCDDTTRAAALAALAEPLGRPTLNHVHSHLLPAMQALPVEALHAAPFHRGEPTPFIGARGHVRFAIFLARAVAHTAAPGDRAAFEAALEAASAHTSKARPPPSPALKAATKLKPTSLASMAARTAAVEANTSVRSPDGTGRSAATTTTKVLLETCATEGPAATRALLAALDDELRRLDALYAFEERDKVPERPVIRAVFRDGPAPPGKGRVTDTWLVECEGGTFALLNKPKTRWQLTVGPRDEVLAVVPDAYFAAATRAAQ